MAPGAQRHIFDTKLGTDKCDSTFMSLTMGYTHGAKCRGQIFDLSKQIYDPKYCSGGPVANGLQGQLATAKAQEYAPGGSSILRLPFWGISHIITSSGFFCIFILFFNMFKCFQLSVCKGQIQMCMRWG